MQIQEVMVSPTSKNPRRGKYSRGHWPYHRPYYKCVRGKRYRQEWWRILLLCQSFIKISQWHMDCSCVWSLLLPLKCLATLLIGSGRGHCPQTMMWDSTLYRSLVFKQEPESLTTVTSRQTRHAMMTLINDSLGCLGWGGSFLSHSIHMIIEESFKSVKTVTVNSWYLMFQRLNKESCAKVSFESGGELIEIANESELIWMKELIGSATWYFVLPVLHFGIKVWPCKCIAVPNQLLC